MKATDHPLIVGVDGSGPSLDALDWAVDMAALWQLPLRIVYGARWHGYEGPAARRTAGQAAAQHVVSAATERAVRRLGAVRVAAEVLPEEPAAMLTRLSAEATAVVVGARGHGDFAALHLGSVGLSVAAHAESPVVVVRGALKSREGGFGVVTVGVDEPGEAGPAVRFAFREAQLRGSVVTAVHAWRWPAQEATDLPSPTAQEHRSRAEGLLAEALRDVMATHPEVRVTRRTPEGRARAVLLDAATTSDLLVVGARRRTTGLGMRLGPVSHALLHHAPCPVAVVPHE